MREDFEMEAHEPSDQSCDDDGFSPKKPRSASEIRKSTKPIMEKRRRARINESLNQLKALILETLRKDSSRHSKLEKADILELTVKHLRSLHRSAALCTADPGSLGRYRAGYSECMGEVTRFLSASDGVHAAVRARLLAHLADCVAGIAPAGGSAAPLGAAAAAAGLPPPALGTAELQLLSSRSSAAPPPAACPVEAAPRLHELLSVVARGGGVRLVSAGDGLLALLVPPAPARSPGASLTPDSSSSSSPPSSTSSFTTAVVREPGLKEGPRGPSRLAHGPQPRALAAVQDVWRPW